MTGRDNANSLGCLAGQVSARGKGAPVSRRRAVKREALAMFPAFRDFERAFIETNDAVMALASSPPGEPPPPLPAGASMFQKSA